MPVDFEPYAAAMPTQRQQYKKSFLTRLYRDFVDERVIRFVYGSDSILDIGCGEGIILEKVAKRHICAKRLWGIDRSALNTKICREYQLTVIQADCYKLCFADNSIDCCILCDVLEHLERPEDAIREIRRVLKKHGRLIIQIPNDTFSKFVNFLIVRRKYDFMAGHVKQWTPQELRRQLLDMNFKIIKQLNIPGYFWPISFHHLAITERL